MCSEFNGRYFIYVPKHKNKANETRTKEKKRKKKLNARFFEYSNAFASLESRVIFYGEQLRIHELGAREMENRKLVSFFFCSGILSACENAISRTPNISYFRFDRSV